MHLFKHHHTTLFQTLGFVVFYFYKVYSYLKFKLLWSWVN